MTKWSHTVILFARTQVQSLLELFIFFQKTGNCNHFLSIWAQNRPYEEPICGYCVPDCGHAWLRCQKWGRNCLIIYKWTGTPLADTTRDVCRVNPQERERPDTCGRRHMMWAVYRPRYVRSLWDTMNVPLKPSSPKREATWDFLQDCRQLVSRCKLYGAYLTVESALCDVYIMFHTGKVRQVSGSVVCMRWLKTTVTTYASLGQKRITPGDS